MVADRSNYGDNEASAARPATAPELLNDTPMRESDVDPVQRTMEDITMNDSTCSKRALSDSFQSYSEPQSVKMELSTTPQATTRTRSLDPFQVIPGFTVRHPTPTPMPSSLNASGTTLGRPHLSKNPIDCTVVQGASTDGDRFKLHHSPSTSYPRWKPPVTTPRNSFGDALGSANVCRGVSFQSPEAFSSINAHDSGWQRSTHGSSVSWGAASTSTSSSENRFGEARGIADVCQGVPFQSPNAFFGVDANESTRPCVTYNSRLSSEAAPTSTSHISTQSGGSTSSFNSLYHASINSAGQSTLKAGSIPGHRTPCTAFGLDQSGTTTNSGFSFNSPDSSFVKTVTFQDVANNSTRTWGTLSTLTNRQGTPFSRATPTVGFSFNSPNTPYGKTSAGSVEESPLHCPRFRWDTSSSKTPSTVLETERSVPGGKPFMLPDGGAASNGFLTFHELTQKPRLPPETPFPSSSTTPMSTTRRNVIPCGSSLKSPTSDDIEAACGSLFGHPRQSSWSTSSANTKRTEIDIRECLGSVLGTPQSHEKSTCNTQNAEEHATVTDSWVTPSTNAPVSSRPSEPKMHGGSSSFNRQNASQVKTGGCFSSNKHDGLSFDAWDTPFGNERTTEVTCRSSPFENSRGSAFQDLANKVNVPQTGTFAATAKSITSTLTRFPTSRRVCDTAYVFGEANLENQATTSTWSSISTGKHLSRAGPSPSPETAFEGRSKKPEDAMGAELFTFRPFDKAESSTTCLPCEIPISKDVSLNIGGLTTGTFIESQSLSTSQLIETASQGLSFKSSDEVLDCAETSEYSESRRCLAIGQHQNGEIPADDSSFNLLSADAAEKETAATLFGTSPRASSLSNAMRTPPAGPPPSTFHDARTDATSSPMPRSEKEASVAEGSGSFGSTQYAANSSISGTVFDALSHRTSRVGFGEP